MYIYNYFFVILKYHFCNFQDIWPYFGPYRYDNGATYVGQYKEGKRHGEGKQVWRDGSCILEII